MCETIAKLVPVTHRIWQDTKAKMLPTPSKFHYVFNFRDISRIWQGMLGMHASGCQNVQTTVSLWKHECLRIISDRFTNQKDVKWFENRIHGIMLTDLGAEYEQQMLPEPCFADFMSGTGLSATHEDLLHTPKLYERIISFPSLSETLLHYQTAYNDTVRGPKLDLVFIKDCMLHIIRVSRIIRTPRGNALLVGVRGAGKQSVTRLASSIAGYVVFQIQLSCTYNTEKLIEDIKILYKLTGIKGKGVTFLLTENEIKSESFLEYINNILATGEIGGLFSREEIEEICHTMLPVMKRDCPKSILTNDAIYSHFINTVRANLHIVLCFSSVGERFRQRVMKFPSILSGCTINWFMAWSSVALAAVADHFLGSLEIICTPEVKSNVIQMMGVVQCCTESSCIDFFVRFRRQAFVTPISYISFLNSYRVLYEEKRKHFLDLSHHVESGLHALVEISSAMEQLSYELEIKEKQIGIICATLNSVLLEVTHAATVVSEANSGVMTVKSKANFFMDTINAVKHSVDEKLATTIPSLAAAEVALLVYTYKHFLSSFYCC